MYWVILALALSGTVATLGCWFLLQLARQNGRILLRIEMLEEEVELLCGAVAPEAMAPGGEPTGSAKPGLQLPAQAGRGKVNRGLAASRLNRTGLKKGTTAPAFRLPGLEGGSFALEDYRGQRVLLVFSDPECGPCQHLAPTLEEFHRTRADIQVLMVSRGAETINRSKAAELGLSFPIALQQSWEISLKYAMFATPIAYVIDEEGIVAQDVVVGAEPIQDLLSKLARPSPEALVAFQARSRH
jgi:peroxiredoxin